MTLNQPLTPISEGIAALVAGDYSRAAERLRPFAERFRTFDPTAAFFLGAMYQNGLGLAPDPMRACALFVRASGHEAMIGQYAQDMFQSFNRRIDRHEFLECTLLGNIGLQHRFHPVTFPLGAGHWISIDLHGATVTYEGVEKHVELGLDLSGIVYVSIDHTPLTAERTAVPRHFIEVFAWVPAENNWVLQWRVFEVVRQQMIAIDTPIVMTSDAEEPPDQLAFDLHAVAHLRVNMRGDVEWVLATGPKEQFAVIPSDADRQQSAERARAQKAADAQVDWSRTVDVDRTPQLSYSRSIGCGASNSDRTEAITFWLVTSGLNLNVTQTFDLRTAEAIGLAVHVFDRAIRDDRWPFCTDTGAPAVGHKIWKPIAGNVTVEFSRPEAVNSEETWVRLKLVVTGAEFMNEAGVRVKQTQPITLSGGVTRSR